MDLRRLLTLKLNALSAVAVGMLGCTEQKGRTAPAANQKSPPGKADAADHECPSVRVMELLHATAFYFEHGSSEQARVPLRQVRALVRGGVSGPTRDIMTALSRISGLMDTDPDEARFETEYVRMTFGDWKCLSDEQHESFHAKLPPIPGYSR